MEKHNKKRNVGIIYELFLRHITSLLVNKKQGQVEVATKILERRFKKGTELFKEFKIFNTLINSSIKSEDLACSLLKETKSIAKSIDQKKLQREKSYLIKDINYNLNDSNFYYRSIPNYRQYANLQNLLNEWKKDELSQDLKSMFEKEQKAINWLLNESKEKKPTIVDEKESDINNLTVGIMTEKINKKYSSFTSDQKEIIQNYALYAVEDQERFASYLSNKKKETLTEILSFKNTCDNNFIMEKIDNVYDKIQSLDVNNIDDASIVKFLTITNLLNELKS